MKSAARVYILYTGGTIGMAHSLPGNASSPLVPQPLSELLKFIPELSRQNIELGFGSFEPPLDSSDIGPAQWRDIARRIEAEYDDYDGFVVLHGTDTLAYTASALAFMFENLAKPVVLTGSQLPISHPNTDAQTNFLNSIKVAGYTASGLLCIPEVVLVFGDKILRGCRARKTSSQSFVGFESPNYPPLGCVDATTIQIDPKLVRKCPEHSLFKVERFLSEEVADITLVPGMRPSQLEKYMESAKGILLRTFGTGNVPGHLLEVIRNAAQNKHIILSVSQCNHGGVDMRRYASGNTLIDMGVIPGSDMTPEAGLTKLMWVLGTKTRSDAATVLGVSQRGELTL